MTAPRSVNLGIDVAGTHLDVAVHPRGEAWTVPRSRGGRLLLRIRVQALDPARIVLEATGGYERAVVPPWPPPT